MKRLRRLLPQVALVAILSALALALTLGAASSDPVYEVTLRARGMAFYLDGDSRPNPPLVLPADRLVRLTLVNEDRGVDHNLVLDGLDARTGVLRGDGSSEVIELRTPTRTIVTTYSCSLHLMMMTAGLEVR